MRLLKNVYAIKKEDYVYLKDKDEPDNLSCIAFIVSVGFFNLKKTCGKVRIYQLDGHKRDLNLHEHAIPYEFKPQRSWFDKSYYIYKLNEKETLKIRKQIMLKNLN